MSQERYYTKGSIKPYRNGYRAQLSYKDSSGNWRKKTKVLTATKKREAEREFEEWRDELESKAAFTKGFAAPPENVGSLVEQYINRLEGSRTVEQSTITSYRNYLKPIKEGLGTIPFEDLDATMVENWVSHLNKSYAPTSVKRYLNLLKAAYKDLADKRLIPYSPISMVKPPKLGHREPNSLDPKSRERLLAYLDVADDTSANLAIKLAMVTGMREAEICGLQWRNVDLKEGVIKVRTALGRDGSRYYLKETKTGASRRNVPINPGTAEELTRHRARMIEDCFQAGIGMQPDFFVFGNIDGTFFSPHELGRQFRAISKSLGLIGTEGKTATFHDLRHTFISTAITSGADAKTVASIVGHSNVAMTLNIYASADKEAQKRTMEDVGKVISETPREASIIALGKTGTED